MPAFESAVKVAHVGAIMDSLQPHQRPARDAEQLLQHADCSQRVGFDSVMMSDWDATYDGVAAANGGLDIEMPTGKFMSPATLSAAVKAGTVTEATINEKVLHILTTAIRFGWLDRPQRDGPPSPTSTLQTMQWRSKRRAKGLCCLRTKATYCRFRSPP